MRYDKVIQKKYMVLLVGFTTISAVYSYHKHTFLKTRDILKANV